MDKVKIAPPTDISDKFQRQWVELTKDYRDPFSGKVYEKGSVLMVGFVGKNLLLKEGHKVWLPPKKGKSVLENIVTSKIK